MANRQEAGASAVKLDASSSDAYYPSSKLVGANLATIRTDLAAETTDRTAADTAEATTRANADAMKVNKSGDTLSGRLTGANLKGAWINTFTSHTALYVPPNDATSSVAQGVLSWRTAQGDGYAINNLSGENITRLRYATNANITNGTNTTTDVFTITGGVVSFAASPAVPGKTTAAGSNATTIATEAQVALKQDKLTATGATNLLTAPATAGGQPGTKPLADLQAKLAATGTTNLLTAPATAGGQPG
ncbi:hypothetical protein NO2_1450, partial [Candidatus Termititenax persephonae]